MSAFRTDSYLHKLQLGHRSWFHGSWSMLGGKLQVPSHPTLSSASQLLYPPDGHVIGICLLSVAKLSSERPLERQLQEVRKQTGWDRTHCPRLSLPCSVQAPPNSDLVMGVVPLVAAIWTVRELPEGCARI